MGERGQWVQNRTLDYVGLKCNRKIIRSTMGEGLILWVGWIWAVSNLTNLTSMHTIHRRSQLASASCVDRCSFVTWFIMPFPDSWVMTD